MRLACMIVFALISSIYGFSQNNFKATIKDKETQEPLPGATALIQGTTIAATANEEGTLEIQEVPNGQQTIEFSFIGYESQTLTITFPTASHEVHQVFLETGHEELEEVVISSTRSSRTIADIPTRVEFIAGEELDEKGNMKPGDIRMLLNES